MYPDLVLKGRNTYGTYIRKTNILPFIGLYAADCLVAEHPLGCIKVNTVYFCLH